jgi:WD40 repeat protein
VWDLATGKELFRRQGFGIVRSLAIAPNSRLLASGQADGTILVWDLPPSAEPNANPEKFEAKQLELWWTDLGGADARKAHAAIWGYVTIPERTVAWLRGRLFAIPTFSADKLRQLVLDLDSPNFQRRAEASKQLEILAEEAEPALRAALEKEPSLEQRKRIDALLSKFNSRLRYVRSVEVLEHIGSAEARKVLDALAKRESDAHLGREAEAALGRLTRRPTHDQ